jgi:hypothetical protein
MGSGDIDQVVRVFMGGPLGPAGFVRKARVWNRSRASLVDVVDLQASRWNEPANQSFAVNLGLFAPSVYRTCWQKEPPAFARHEDCLVQWRLSERLGEVPYGRQKDQWWTIRQTADIETIGNEVGSLLVSSAIPLFDRFQSLTDVLEGMEKGAGSQAETPLSRIYLAVVKAELGNLAAARSILNDVGSTAPGAWRDRVSAVTRELTKKSA